MPLTQIFLFDSGTASPSLQLCMAPPLVTAATQPFTVPGHIPFSQPFPTVRPILVPGGNGFYGSKFQWTRFSLLCCWELRFVPLAHHHCNKSPTLVPGGNGFSGLEFCCACGGSSPSILIRTITQGTSPFEPVWCSKLSMLYLFSNASSTAITCNHFIVSNWVMDNWNGKVSTILVFGNL